MKRIILATVLSAASVTAAAAVTCPRIASDIMANAAVTMGQMEFQSLVQTCENGRSAKSRGISFDSLYRNIIIPNAQIGNDGGVDGAYGASLARIALLEGFAQ